MAAMLTIAGIAIILQMVITTYSNLLRPWVDDFSFTLLKAGNYFEPNDQSSLQAVDYPAPSGMVNN
jgi:hypothetical protein